MKNLIPSQFRLLQNYPNPFNPTTNIQFAIQEISNVVIQVINLRGEIIFYKSLNNLEPGYYNQIWDAGSQSAGIYFCKILIGDRIQETIKMVLIK